MLLFIIIITIIIITVTIHSHSSSVSPSHWEPEPNGQLESRRDSERHRHLLGDSVARGHLRSLCRGGPLCCAFRRVRHTVGNSLPSLSERAGGFLKLNVVVDFLVVLMKSLMGEEIKTIMVIHRRF